MAKLVTKQDIIEDLRRVFKQLGRSFNTADYGRTGKFHRDNIPKRFGSFDNALEEAGLKEEFRELESKRRLEVAGDTKTKIKSIQPKWSKIKASSKKHNKKDKTIFIISDLHVPFMNEIYIEKMLKAIALEKPDYVVQIGDAFDLYSFSRFAKTANLATPNEEFIRGKMLVEKLWKTIQKIAPKAKLYQLSGNHESRLTSRLINNAPELEPFVDFQKPFEIKGVTRLTSAREFLELENIIFCHGYFSPSGAHVRHFAKSVVFGHSHRGRVEWFNEELFELNVGHLCNTKALPFSYTQSVITKWKAGWGIIHIINGKPVPKFVPVNED
jgi:predicted phosphodiesterase